MNKFGTKKGYLLRTVLMEHQAGVGFGAEEKFILHRHLSGAKLTAKLRPKLIFSKLQRKHAKT